MPEESGEDVMLFLFKKFCGLIRIRKTQTKWTEHYGRSLRIPAVTRHFGFIMWLQGEHSCFEDHFMPNAISMWQVVQDRCFRCLSRTAKALVRSQASPFGICGRRSGAGKGFSSACPGFPLSVSLNQRSTHIFQSYTIEAM